MVEEKRQHAISSNESARESRDRDTQSSAGDKHETSRAMVQIELDKAQIQLAKADKLQVDLSSLDADQKHEKVEFGSVFKSNRGYLFMSIGIGKVIIDKKEIFMVSMASPIAQVLKNMRSGESAHFQGKVWELPISQPSSAFCCST